MPQKSQSVPEAFEPASSDSFDYFVSFRRTGTLGISVDAFEQHFEEADKVAVYWNEEDEVLAIKTAEEDAVNTYRLTRTDSGGGATVHLTPWLKAHSRIPEETLQFKAEWDSEYEMLTADLTQTPSVYGSDVDPDEIKWVSSPVRKGDSD